jgi:hypothetical protein
MTRPRFDRALGLVRRAHRSAVLALALSLAVICSPADAQYDRPVIDPDVRAAIAAGPQRVLVELHVASAEPSALRNAQDEVLRRLAGTGAALLRRYATAPVLALEVDAAALAGLEQMPALVKRVRADRITRPSEGSAPPR